jgi:hypothetical protein
LDRCYDLVVLIISFFNMHFEFWIISLLLIRLF